MAEVERVMAAVETGSLELIRFLYVDHGGIIRGKATSRPQLAERIRSGIGLTVAMQAMSMLDQLQAQGLDVEQYYPELGHGQQELSIRHSPALAAADRRRMSATSAAFAGSLTRWGPHSTRSPADELLMGALGPLRSSAYLAVKRSEVAAFGARDLAFECFHHFTKF